MQQCLSEEPGERPDHLDVGLRTPRVLESPLNRLGPLPPAARCEVTAAA
jgi:hypothetical protein